MHQSCPPPPEFLESQLRKGPMTSRKINETHVTKLHISLQLPIYSNKIYMFCVLLSSVKIFRSGSLLSSEYSQIPGILLIPLKLGPKILRTLSPHSRHLRVNHACSILKIILMFVLHTFRSPLTKFVVLLGNVSAETDQKSN